MAYRPGSVAASLGARPCAPVPEPPKKPALPLIFPPPRLPPLVPDDVGPEPRQSYSPAAQQLPVGTGIVLEVPIAHADPELFVVQPQLGPAHRRLDDGLLDLRPAPASNLRGQNEQLLLEVPLAPTTGRPVEVFPRAAALPFVSPLSRPLQ